VITKMINKKGQVGVIIFLLFIVGIIGIGVWILTTPNNDTDNDEDVLTNPENGNEPSHREPNIKILDNNKCLNQKDQFGIRVKCTISVHNLEKILAVQLQPEFKCWKLAEPAFPEYINAEKKAIISGGVEEFTVRYDNDGREWSCMIDNLNADKIPVA